MIDKLFIAMKAFILHEGKLLLLKEAPKYSDATNVGRFDVAGGRLEKGERFDKSLLREIKEETGLDVTIGRPFFVNEWRPTVRGEQWQIIGTFFICHASTKDVVLSEDHDNFVWIDPKAYEQYEVIENLKPVFAAFLEVYK